MGLSARKWYARLVKIVSVGGGPGGLYFSILMKLARPEDEIIVFERNRADDTFGFGVVFSDATLGNLAEADPETYQQITDHFAHWDDIDIHYRDEVHRSTGHGFSGLSRKTLLKILTDRARSLGVDLRFETELSVDAIERHPDLLSADLILAADGVNSQIRNRYAEHLGPDVDMRPNRFVWLGTTYPFEAFTFYFKGNEHGLWRVHAYRYEEGNSTFIIECTDETLRATGLDEADEDATVAYCEALFAEELKGHKLLKNRSVWRAFPTVKNAKWHHKNIVLLGDAAHTAHFSIGSGTKLAMEDAIALRQALLQNADVPTALVAYEADRRPTVDSTQRAAQVSLEWFENTERYLDFEPIQFSFSLLTRSLRVTHDNLKVRDEAFVDRVDRWFQARAEADLGRKLDRPTPPMFTPFKLRDLELPNRVVVSPMCQYSAEDGTISDWHLVHLGSRAMGGAGLVMTEMTDVSASARITPGCAGMYKPEHVKAWRRVTDFVHENSFAKIGMQLAHAGRKGSTKVLWEGMDQPLDTGNWPLLSPSALPYLEVSQVPKAMDRADMDQVADDFVRAAQMAKEAGFDVLELHLAHGYLLGTFISPLTNRRQDEYGGDIEGRMRFPLEVVRKVRGVWDGPLSARISATDWAPDGLSEADLITLAKALKAHCDIIDVSTGQTVADQKPVYGRLYQTPFAERVKIEADVRTMTVGNISSFTDVNSILVAGRADLCMLARAHLYDPYWTRHAAQEQGYALEWPDQYKSLTRYNFRFK